MKIDIVNIFLHINADLSYGEDSFFIVVSGRLYMEESGIFTMNWTHFIMRKGKYEKVQMYLLYDMCCNLYWNYIICS